MIIPSKEEIEKQRTANGGYTKSTLAKWGIDWPPPSGWKQKLIKQHTQWQQQRAIEKIKALRKENK